jgi:hypothetical protein
MSSIFCLNTPGKSDKALRCILSEWKIDNIETEFYRALRNYRARELMNEQALMHHLGKLRNPTGALETLDGRIIRPDYHALEQYLSLVRVEDMIRYEESYHKFRSFMNKADDYYFRGRRHHGAS